MKRSALIKDLENMEEIMDRTVNRCDLWQDRFIYWMAVALFHLLTMALKEQEEKK